MRKIIFATALAASAVCLVSCSNNNNTTQENKTVSKDTVAKPRWVDPQKGKIWGKVNYVQIPLTAMEHHILGPVKSVRYTDYKISEKDGSRELDDSGYNQYDKAGHLIDQNEYSKDGKPKRKCVYNYDAQNRATLWDLKVYGSKMMTKVTFKYDDKGRKTEQNEVAAKKEDSRRLVYKYDDKGNELEEAEYYGDKKPWITTFKYDSRGYQTEYAHRDETGRLLMKMTQEYDSAGNRISGVTYTSDTVVRTKWTAKNDNKGRCTELVTYTKDGKIRSVTKMKYDDWDNVVEYMNYKSDGSIDNAGWNSYTDFEYDSHGNTVKETYYKLKAGKKVMTDVAEKKYEYY